jgi:hypothetical protein
MSPINIVAIIIVLLLFGLARSYLTPQYYD